MQFIISISVLLTGHWLIISPFQKLRVTTNKNHTWGNFMSDARQLYSNWHLTWNFPLWCGPAFFWEIFMSDASYYIVVWHLTWNFPKYIFFVVVHHKQLPDMVFTVFPDTYWGNFMSDARSLFQTWNFPTSKN